MSLPYNYFEIFKLPISFDVDTHLLAQRYQELQRTVHPDNYANAPERERRLALQRTAQINEAFQTLKNPLSRGRYLLQLQGVNLHKNNNTVMDNEFLMTQMALHEELAQIKQDLNPIEKLNIFLTHIEDHQQQLTSRLSHQFAQDDFQQAQDSIHQFQFFQRLHEKALRLEEELI